MHCPACDQSLQQETLHGEQVDRCPGCGGLWLDHSELGAIARQLEAPAEAVAKSQPQAEGSSCPRCAGTLQLINYAFDSGVHIGRCGECGGAWLEDGQLEEIARFLRGGSPAMERLAGAYGERLRQEGRLGVVRGALRSRWLSGAVALAYLGFGVYSGASPLQCLWISLSLLVPLACIWFPDAAGSLTGVSFGIGCPVVTQQTPGDFVAFAGWLLLLSPLWFPLIGWASGAWQ